MGRAVSMNGTLVTLTWSSSANSSGLSSKYVYMESALRKQFFSPNSSVNEVSVEINQRKNSWQLLNKIGVLPATFNPEEQVSQRIGDALTSIRCRGVNIVGSTATTDAITLHYNSSGNISTVFSTSSYIARCVDSITRKFPTSMFYKLRNRAVVPASCYSPSSSGLYELSRREYSRDASFKSLISIEEEEGSVSVQLSGLCLSAISPVQTLCPPNITVAGLVVTEIGYQESCSGSPGKLFLRFQRQSNGNGSVISQSRDKIDDKEEDRMQEEIALESNDEELSTITDSNKFEDIFIGASYSSSRTPEMDATITSIVSRYITERKLLRVINDNFGGDLEPFKSKYLVLLFTDDVTRVYRESEVVNFTEIEEEWTRNGKIASRKVNQVRVRRSMKIHQPLLGV